MPKASPSIGVSHYLPFPARVPNIRDGVGLHPKRLAATIAGAFLIVAASAWALAALNETLGVRAAERGGSETVAFQPSRFVREELSGGYLSR